MNDLEMELQTIRQKLKTLKAAPPETVAAPWVQSRLTAPSPSLAQVTTAIATLRQRSGQTQPPAPDSSLQQFDDILTSVDSLAQQQQKALQQLQRLGDSLAQQSQPGTSPAIDDIVRFLSACQTIQIPTIQRDANGYLGLHHRSVNFRQAEYDATSNADALRMRSQLFKHTLQPQEAEEFDRSPISLLNELKRIYQPVYRALQRWSNRYLSPSKQPRTSHFTLLDGAIWGVGAVIVRIVLNQLFQIYAALWTPVALMVIVGVIVSLYRSILSPRPDPVLGYRTLMIIVGLLIGGRFS
ncbi:MAG: hypothetical protein AAF959_29955 [Cyanobacteria bacterium P01_D01_bin.56]